MNSSVFIVKIISTPKQKQVSNGINLVETEVQFGKLRKKKSFDHFNITLWGSLGKDLLKYYRINDYIIIKGVLSVKRSQSEKRFQKKINMTVTKFYPYLLPE